MLTTFVIICVVMSLLAILFVFVPLWRGKAADGMSGAERREAVLAILRQQAADLEKDREAGRIDQDEYEETRQELEHRVLEETRAQEKAKTDSSGQLGKVLAVVSAIAIPAIAVSGYLMLGRYSAMDEDFLKMVNAQRQQQEGGMGHSQAEMQEAITQLQARLKENPNDLNTLYLLARTYASVNRFDEAYNALKDLNKQIPDNADIVADMADMLAAANGKVITKEVEDLLNEALRLDPNQWKALALLAIHNWDKERYAEAARLWEHLLEVVPPDFPDREQIQSNINEAKRLGGVNDKMGTSRAKASPATNASEGQAPNASSAPVPTVQPGPVASIQGTVEVSANFKDRVKPTDTVFIYARPVAGSKMPVAFLKVTAADLPYTFDLQDNMMMATGKRHLSDEKTVIVGARLSSSGNFMAQAGDLEGELAQPVEVGAKGVKIVIDTLK